MELAARPLHPRERVIRERVAVAETWWKSRNHSTCGTAEQEAVVKH